MTYTATEMAKKLNISRSYLYYLKEKQVIDFDINDEGKVIWTEEVYNKLFEYIKKINLNRKPVRRNLIINYYH